MLGFLCNVSQVQAEGEMKFNKIMKAAWEIILNLFITLKNRWKPSSLSEFN